MATYQFDNLYTFDSNAGIVIPDTSDLKSRVEDMMRSIFGTNIDVTAETPMGRLIETIVVLMVQTLSINAANANQYNLNQTSGIYLDAIGALFGLTRNAATHTRVLCNVTGTANVTIPTSAIAENNAGYKFLPENPITIGEDGKGQGYFLASETGAIPCDYGTLTTIVSGVEGWLTVSNDTDTFIVYGTDLESDKVFRERILSARSTGSSNTEAIANAIYNADTNVKSVCVLENGYSVPIVKKNVVIPAHSIFVCVYGGNQDAIAKAIFEKKTAGAGYTYKVGNHLAKPVAVEDSWSIYNVYYFEPLETTLNVDLSIDKYLYAGISLETDVKSAVKNYIVESGIGATISRESVTTYLAQKLPSIKVMNVIIKESGGSYQDAITLNGDCIGSVSDSSITIVEV